jgi:hypothetical protein
VGVSSVSQAPAWLCCGVELTARLRNGWPKTANGTTLGGLGTGFQILEEVRPAGYAGESRLQCGARRSPALESDEGPVARLRSLPAADPAADPRGCSRTEPTGQGLIRALSMAPLAPERGDLSGVSRAQQREDQPVRESRTQSSRQGRLVANLRRSSRGGRRSEGNEHAGRSMKRTLPRRNDKPVRDRAVRARLTCAKAEVRGQDPGAPRNRTGVWEVACMQGWFFNWGGPPAPAMRSIVAVARLGIRRNGRNPSQCGGSRSGT